MKNNTTEKRFVFILDSMDSIPENRKSINEVNLLWFLRNGSVFNRSHSKYDESVSLCKQLLKKLDA